MRLGRRIFLSLGCLWFLTLFVPESRPAEAVRLSLDALVRNSQYVVYGRAMRTQAVKDPATGSIWTRTEFLVLDGAKGQVGSAITVQEPGGILDGKGELYPGIPVFRVNDEVVLFLYWAPGDRLRVTGLLQGVFPVIADPGTGERKVRPVMPGREAVYEEGSKPVPVGRESAARDETLAGFLYTIRQRAAVR